MKNIHWAVIALALLALAGHINHTDGMGDCKAKGHSHEYCSGELLK